MNGLHLCFPRCFFVVVCGILLTASADALMRARPVEGKETAVKETAEEEKTFRDKDKKDKPASSPAAEQSAAPQTTPPKRLFTGKVVLLEDAFQRRGIKASPKEIAGQVVLETPEGELIPIVPDWRGRAFFQDARLRNRKVDLVGYRRKGVPYLQVLMIFVYNNRGEREYMDYWCDICSIPMYEIKPCECCQGPIRLRFQKRPLPAYLPSKSHSGRPQRHSAGTKASPPKSRAR